MRGIVHKKDFVDMACGDLGWHLSDGGGLLMKTSNLFKESSKISFSSLLTEKEY